MSFRTCKACLLVKPLSTFHKSKTNAEGRALLCPDCRKAKRRALHAADPEKYARIRRAAFERNRDKELAYNNEWAKNNKHRRKPARKEVLRAACARWRSRHPEKAHAYSRARNAASKKATPPWADMAAIREIFVLAVSLQKMTGRPHHVDHVVPLRGRTVSGLHVHWNLRILPARLNLRKHSKVPRDPDMAIRRSETYVRRVLELNKKRVRELT